MRIRVMSLLLVVVLLVAVAAVPVGAHGLVRLQAPELSALQTSFLVAGVGAGVLADESVVPFVILSAFGLAYVETGSLDGAMRDGAANLGLFLAGYVASRTLTALFFGD